MTIYYIMPSFYVTPLLSLSLCN